MIKNIIVVFIVISLCVFKNYTTHTKNDLSPLLQVMPISLINMQNVPMNMTASLNIGKESVESFADTLGAGIKGVYYGYHFIKNAYPYFIAAKGFIDNLSPETLSSLKNIKLDLHSLVERTVDIIASYSTNEDIYNILKVLSD